MSRAKERNVLKAILRRIEPQSSPPVKTTLPAWFQLLVMAIVFWAVMNTILANHNTVLLCLISAFIGAIVVWALAVHLGNKQWAVLHRYIDKESVKARLRELET